MKKLSDKIDQLVNDVAYIRRKVSFLEGKLAGISVGIAAVVSIVIAVLFSASCASTFPLHLWSGLDRIDDSVVALVYEDGRVYCTGFLAEGRVVTADHCIDGASHVYVGLRSGMTSDRNGWHRARRVEVLAEDNTHDVAILETPSRRALPELRLRDAPVVAGEEVMSIGHPWAIPYFHSFGHVSGRTRGGFGNWPTHPFFLTDAVVRPGMSGGPVIDTSGMVVGINSFGVDGVVGILPVSSIRAALSSLR